MKKKLIIIAFVGVLWSCGPSSQKESGGVNTKTLPVLSKDLIGEWRNISLKVTIHEEGIDSVVNVPADQWEEILQIKPIRTTFKKDSTYVSEYRSLEDSVIMTSTGVWFIKNDSLEMIERGTSNVYHATISGDTAEFDGYLDWDEDGDADDHYYGKQKKQ